MDMYGISRGIIFCFFWKIADSTLTDSTDSRIPCGFRQKRSATLPRLGLPAPHLNPRARGIPLGLEPYHGVEQGNNLLPLAHFTGGQRAQIIAGAQGVDCIPLVDHLITLAFAHIESQERHPLVLSPDSM